MESTNFTQVDISEFYDAAPQDQSDTDDGIVL